VKPAKSATNFLVIVSNNGTTKGGLGKVVFGVGKLGGQALASDWLKNHQILAEGLITNCSHLRKNQEL